jgi:hypothetical protein
MTQKTINDIRLVKRVIKLSESAKWEKARKEWKVIGINPTKDKCICGKNVEKTYIIKNDKTNNITRVGETCLEYFNNKYMDLVKDRFLCTVCNYHIITKRSYDEHCKSIDHMKKKTCCNCNKIFKNKLTLFKHFTTDKDGLKGHIDEYYCKKCHMDTLKKCINCNSAFAKIKETVYWKRTCAKCYYNSKK